MTYGEMKQQAEDYYLLCDQAEALGIPTSLDDPMSPTTVEDLRDAAQAAWDSESRLSPYATVWSPAQDDEDGWQRLFDQHFATHRDEIAAIDFADANVEVLG